MTTLWWTGRAIALAAAIFTVSGASAVTAEEIKMGGTGNALGAMQLLGEAFSQQNPDIKVTVLPSLGSSGAVKAIPAGAIDIELSSRPLTEDESRHGAIAVEYARTPLVFATPATARVTAITTDQLVDIYSGQLLNWPDGSPIRPVLRQSGDDNLITLTEPSAAVQRFMAFIQSPAGREILTRTGHWTP